MNKLIVGLLLAISLAGCAAPETPSQDPNFEIDEDLQATETTGVIRGIVVDETVTPVEGATVRIASEDLQTTSNQNGAFGFQDLPPGSYFLAVTKPGYQAVQVSAQVVAGIDEPPVVKALMTADASTTPYVEEHVFQGHVRCGASYVAACGAAAIVGQDVGDDFMAVFELNAMPQYITMEAVWEGSQPTGDNFQLRLGSTPAGPATVAATATGPSPQQARANSTLIQQFGIGGANDLVGRMFVWEMEGTNIEGHTGQCVPVPTLTVWCHGPGVAVDQPFELFVHAFHRFEPPADWRFTDSAPPEA